MHTRSAISETIHPLQADALNNPVTLRDPARLPLLNDFVECFIASQARGVNLQLALTALSLIVQAWPAALHLFVEIAGAAKKAKPFIAATDRQFNRVRQSMARMWGTQKPLISAV